MDPYTLAIEAVGIAIAVIWMVVPAREFAEIFRRLRRQAASRAALDSSQPDREGRPS